MKKIFTLLFSAMSAVGAMAANDGNVVKYDFENYRLNAELKQGETEETSKGNYYVWSDLSEDGVMTDIWATGNPGFKMSKGSSTPGEFPSTVVKDGYDGACVKLTTQSTGMFGALAKMPLAAGNLFIGKFDVSSALKDAMKATKFGMSFKRKPLKMTGYYKYKAGAKLQDKEGNTIEGVDKGQIYAVLYRNQDGDGNPVCLYGDDVLTSPQIVAVADLGEISDVAEWTSFEKDFEYKGEIDDEVLKAGGYSMATVFTSSVKGASFIGAVGSTMYVDKVAIECEPEPKTFTGSLVVTMGTITFPTETASISITEQNDGKYTLTLKNFMLQGAGVGTIIVKDVEGVEKDGAIELNASQTIKIEAGDDPDVDYWMGTDLDPMLVEIKATMSDSKLDATIDIDFMGGINVVFGGVPTGISNVISSDKKTAAEGIYTLGGAKVSSMQSGNVYILRNADGTAKKVIKK